MNITPFFTELTKSDSAIAGGKGASLGEMTQAGIPVPPGFVVTTSAFDQFITEAGLKTEIEAILHTSYIPVKLLRSKFVNSSYTLKCQRGWLRKSQLLL